MRKALQMSFLIWMNDKYIYMYMYVYIKIWNVYCYVVNPEWTFRYDFSGFYFIESFRIEAGKMWVVSTLLYIMVLTAELLWSWRAFLVPIIGVFCLPFTTFLSNLDGGMKLEEWYTFNKSEMTLACRGLRMGYMPMVSYSRARV